MSVGDGILGQMLRRGCETMRHVLRQLSLFTYFREALDDL